MNTVQRAEEVDGIRLAALLGICVVNLPFMGLPIAEAFSPPSESLDRLAMVLVGSLFQIKFFLLFAFVFGWGVASVRISATYLSPAVVRARYFRRQAALALFGVAHALLVFTGDILLLYGVVGLLLWPLREASPQRLFRCSLIAIAFSMMALATLAVGLDMAMAKGVLMSAYPEAGLAGDYWQTLVARVKDWPATFGFLCLLQGPLIFAAFCLGMLSVRVNLFQPGSEAFTRLQRRVPQLLLIAIPTNIWYAVTVGDLWQGQPEILQLAGFTAIAVGAPALAACYLVAIVNVVRRLRLPDVFLQAGRNSLSVYILQGIMSGWVFGGYGLGLFDRLGQALMLPLSIVIALLSILLVGWYASHLGRGPLEPWFRRLAGVSPDRQ